MEFTDFVASKNDNNRRLDKVLRNFLDDTKLSDIYKLIRKGLIKVNKTKTKPDYRVKEDDVISIASFILKNDKSISATDSKQSALLSKELKIIFENEHILIIDKPYDINVHGSDNSLEKIVNDYYKTKYKNDSLSFKSGPLHRLDRKTTGLLAFGFSLEGTQWFTQSIKNHTISKKYYAILQGEVKSQEKWCDFITAQDDEGSENDKNFHTVKATQNPINENSKKAITIVNPIKYGEHKSQKITLVSIEIQTGRKHQIRSQSALHGFPLLGDTAYGGVKITTEKREFFLQAYELTFGENPLGLPEKIEIPLAPDFQLVQEWQSGQDFE